MSSLDSSGACGIPWDYAGTIPGARSFYNSGAIPIKKVADLKGLKIRCPAERP